MSSMKTASRYDSDFPAAPRPVGADTSAVLLAVVVLFLVLAASASAQSLWPAGGETERGMYADRGGS